MPSPVNQITLSEGDSDILDGLQQALDRRQGPGVTLADVAGFVLTVALTRYDALTRRSHGGSCRSYNDGIFAHAFTEATKLNIPLPRPYESITDAGPFQED